MEFGKGLLQAGALQEGFAPMLRNRCLAPRRLLVQSPRALIQSL